MQPSRKSPFSSAKKVGPNTPYSPPLRTAELQLSHKSKRHPINQNLKDLYRDTIMRHSKTPQNRSAEPDAPHQAKLTNPLCGDEVSIYLYIDDSKISKATFEGQCCALCSASASMLTSEIQDLNAVDIKEFATSLIDCIKTDADISATATRSTDLQSLSGVTAFPSRKRCVTLPWEVLLDALPQRSEDRGQKSE